VCACVCGFACACVCVCDFTSVWAEGASIAVTTSEAPVSSKPSSKRKANDDPATPNQDDVAESKFTEEEAMNTKKLKNDDSKRESARICLTQTVEVMRSALLHSDTTSLRQSAQISSCQSEVTKLNRIRTRGAITTLRSLLSLLLFLFATSFFLCVCVCVCVCIPARIGSSRFRV
jgi:hypothetical protein